MRSDMENWKEIRQQVLVNGLSRRAACEKYQLGWQTLKKILSHSEPPGYRQKEARPRPVLAPVLPIIHEILVADQKAPKKQRHTAKRIFERLKAEYGYRISYDNSAIAVIEVFQGRERKLTKEFLRLQSHYLFQEHFCLVRRPNEKGNVERLIGFARRNFLVPVPEISSLEDLNTQLMERCVTDRAERTRGKNGAKEELLREDQAAFLPLPKQAFEARRVVQRTADSQSLIRFDDNDYSVPVHYAHRRLTVVATVSDVRLVFDDRLVATHTRCWERERTFFEPIHYLALLERKPGGIDYARPLESWNLPECWALLRRRLEAHDPRHGTRSYIQVLRLLEKFPLHQLTAAVEYALDIDVIDAASIRTIVEHRSDRPVQLFPLDGRPHLAHVQVETTDVSSYQTLLSDPASHTEVSP